MSGIFIFGIAIVYFGGVYRFWAGFYRTHFNQTLPNRLILSVLWPALWIANKSYRQSFRKALKG